MKEPEPGDAIVSLVIIGGILLAVFGGIAKDLTQRAAPFFPSVCGTGWGRFAAREECKLVALQNLEAKK